MTETTETQKTQTPRCGKGTSSGPCVRPENHGAGHMSAEVLRVKTENAKAKKGGGSLTVEELKAREAERRAAAAKKIKEAEAAQKAKIEKLREQAKALGFELVKIEEPKAEAGAESAE